MTIKELIEELNKYDENLEVVKEIEDDVIGISNVEPYYDVAILIS